MAEQISLFVYGTLRCPVTGPPADTHFHERIADGIIAAEPATLRQAQLFDLGSYPGIGRGRSTVAGDLFEVTAQTLATADEIEGHPDFYRRELETIVRADGSRHRAWVYWTPRPLLADAVEIASGDWFDRQRGRVDSAPMVEQLAHDKSTVAVENP